jgi:hypothetical protein
MDDYLFTYGVKYDIEQIVGLADSHDEFVCKISGERHLAAISGNREYIFVTPDDGQNWLFDHSWTSFGLIKKSDIDLDGGAQCLTPNRYGIRGTNERL